MSITSTSQAANAVTNQARKEAEAAMRQAVSDLPRSLGFTADQIHWLRDRFAFLFIQGGIAALRDSRNIIALESLSRVRLSSTPRSGHGH